MTVKVREGREEEVPAMLEVAKDLQHGEKERWFTEKAVETMEREFPAQERLVAVEKGKVIGFLTFSRSDGGDTGEVPEGEWMIDWIGVLRERQGEGIGTAMVEEMVERVEGDIYVETVSPREKDERYLETVEFYEGAGFVLWKEKDMRGEGPKCWMAIYRKTAKR